MLTNALQYEENRLFESGFIDGCCDEVTLQKRVYSVHSQVVLDFIYTYLVGRGIPNAQQVLCDSFITDGYSAQYVENLELEDIPQACEKLHIAYLGSGFSFQHGIIKRLHSKENMVSGGKVYTQSAITQKIVHTTLSRFTTLDNLQVLDFACGTGRFYDDIIGYFQRNGIETEKAVLFYVDAIDIDKIAINIVRLKACSYIAELSPNKIQVISQRIQQRNALEGDEKVGLFSQETREKQYDAIVSNPPYLVLKPSHKTSKELREDMKRQTAYYRSCGRYHYSLEGMLNLYQLSIERMVDMLRKGGELGVICPSTLFADKSAGCLRKYLLCQNTVREIVYYPEKAVLFENNVTQATNIFYLQRGGATTDIVISNNTEEFQVNLSLIKELFPIHMEIPLISVRDWDFLKRMSKFQKLKSISEVRNKRGELDLTLNNKHITQQKTAHRLVRGKMITETGLQYSGMEYVDDSFLQSKSMEYMRFDYGKPRLIGQNISNIDSTYRLRFVFCAPTDILGNSCNYLSASLPTLKKLKILLSSSILNWRFKLTSSNNHINNYELDELPIVDLQLIDADRIFSTQQELDEYVGELYGFSKEELKAIAYTK